MLWTRFSLAHPQHEADSSRHYFWGGALHVMCSPWLPSYMMLGSDVHQTRESCFSESEGSLGVLIH